MTYAEYMQNFDAEAAVDATVKWISAWIDKNGYHGGLRSPIVVGISGGKDSTVVAALCAKAEGAGHIIVVLMPNGRQHDIGDSYEVIRAIGIPDTNIINVNIKGACTAIAEEIYANLAPLNHEITEQARINLPARLRMATLYAVSQSFGGRVVNTCNLSEDYIGYSTRWGDSVGDFSPLANFTTDEVIAMGRVLGLPAHLIEKTPSDGLCGKTDEDNLGFTYRKLNEYIRLGDNGDELCMKTIDRMHEKNKFKLEPMPTFNYFKEN